MRAVVLTVTTLLLAGCSVSDDPATTGPSQPAGLGSPPPGWSQDRCDTRPPMFSGNAKVPDLFRRGNASSPEPFARRIVEAAGDELRGAYEDTSSRVMMDPHHWRTRDGYLSVYWHLDPGAWRALYVTTESTPLNAQHAENRTAVAHAVLGALQVSVDGLAWTTGDESLQATRQVGGAPMALVSVADVRMQAEQANLMRRSIDVNPPYDAPAQALLGIEEAHRIAQTYLDCHASAGGEALLVNATLVQVLGFAGNLAYWAFVEPVSGWENGACGFADAGRLHVGLDAVTGTVLSTDLSC